VYNPFFFWDLPVHVALAEEPGNLVPAGIAQLLNLLVVHGNFFGKAIIGEGSGSKISDKKDSERT
jgi:hypothetical protein